MISDDLPGGPMASRPVHFFWIVDASSSMGMDGKMAQVDTAIRETLPEMKDVAADNPTAELFVRVITFSSHARWLVPQPTPIEQFNWPGVEPDGLTDFGEALRLVASQLEEPPMPIRALPPVLAVISDGMPTDDWRSGLRQLNDARWASKCVRLAILIGHDQDPSVLEEFTGNAELVFRVDTAPQLSRAIRWASTVAVRQASEGRQTSPEAGSEPVPNMTVPDDDDDPTDDVWY